MNFTDRPILVIGDVILDRYISGHATRLSPEAPVPIVKLHDVSISENLGGAGNVAANIKSLGGNPVLVAVTGHDDGAIAVDKLLFKNGISSRSIVIADSRKTTVKTRVIANGHQVVRIDDEDTECVQGRAFELVERYIGRCADDAAAIVISDYGKGMIWLDLMHVLKRAIGDRKIPVFLDPKVVNKRIYGFDFITAMTPNDDESIGLAGIDYSLDNVAQTIMNTYGHPYVVITHGANGLTLHKKLDLGACYIPSAAKQVFDVSGAGDTVIASLALAHASGYFLPDAARIANTAAGIVVGKPGTATVTLSELENA